MATGDVTIDGQKYHFNSNGILSNTTSPTGSRTIKNYLAGALQPVGQALYVWGGGWNDSTRKGTSQTMTDFYNSQSSSYDYNNYRDLSTANRAKGFDCSGFVGWSAYQVMQSKSGVGSGYTVVSGEIGSYYKSMGWEVFSLRRIWQVMTGQYIPEMWDMTVDIHGSFSDSVLIRVQ